MSSLLLGHDQAVAEWVGQVNGKLFHPPYAAFGLVQNGKLTGGFVFTTYTVESVELSLAGASVVSREAWRSVLNYVFEQLGCVRLEIHTRRSNRRVKKLAARGGFYFEGVSRRLYGSEDGLCYSLIKDDLPKFKERWKL